MSSNYLKVEYLDEFSSTQDPNSSEYTLTPFAKKNSGILFATIEDAQKLTEDDQDVKRVHKLSLNSSDSYNFLPGDTIGIIPQNNRTLVDRLLKRLNIEKNADKFCEIKIIEGATKKNAVVPKHLPIRTSLRDVFLRHVDIHTPPKKIFLKSLANHVENPDELLKLEQLCLPKASKEYIELITRSRNLLGLLETFPSCHPPIETLLEHLPPMMPRPYSISSSPLSGKLEITFFVYEREDGSKGLCTGWLEDLILHKREEKVAFYFRQPTLFRIPEDSAVPLILIATGTGIAPFRGFFQHRKVGEGCIWLFYGCRYENKDFLFKDEILEFVKKGVISKLDVAFSRDDNNKVYVQNNIERNCAEFSDWVLKKGAKIFVCGDAKTVVKDVKSTIVKILMTSGSLDAIQSDNFMSDLVKNQRFVVDTWI